MAISLAENIIQEFGDLSLDGVSETVIPFLFDCSAKDFLLFGEAKLSGVSGEGAFISLENSSRSFSLQVGIGYDFGTLAPDQDRISIRARAASDYTSAGTAGNQTVYTYAEFAMHMDCDRGSLNLWVRNGPKWRWVGGCQAPRFEIDHVRFWTRAGSAAPTNQSVKFRNVSICRPNCVSIGDSITAGHNTYDPNVTHYAGNDNGYSQWQAHCWPFGCLRNSIMVNKGIGGQTTAQVNARIAEVHKHGNPVVLLSVQNNDAGKGVGLEQRTASIQSSIDSCVTAGCTVVLIGAIYPNNNPTTSAYYKQWRDEQLPLLTGHAGYIEIMDAVADPATGNISSSYTTDGVHPNVTGYGLIGEKIAADIAAIFSA